MLQSNMAIIIQNGRPEMFQSSYLSRYSTVNENFSVFIIVQRAWSLNLIFYSILEFKMAAKIQNGGQKVINFYILVLKLSL